MWCGVNIVWYGAVRGDAVHCCVVYMYHKVLKKKCCFSRRCVQTRYIQGMCYRTGVSVGRQHCNIEKGTIGGEGDSVEVLMIGMRIN